MENLEPPATLKKSFFLASGGIDAWIVFKTILYILYFGLCLHSTDFGTGVIVTRNGMIIHMMSRCNTILRGSVHFLGENMNTVKKAYSLSNCNMHVIE